MKFIKQMAHDFASPFRTNGSAAALTPFAVLMRIESFLDTVLHGVKASIDKRNTATPAATKPPVIESMPLIKASTPVVEKNDAHFAGRSVLCVGGQIRLYPAYRQIVEDARGRFLSFHGGAEASITGLHALLSDTDFVICPIDCIRHDAFFITKQYCQRFCKPCVMLDKSRVTTFYNGIRMLKNLQ